jgi:hypothetical protein
VVERRVAGEAAVVERRVAGEAAVVERRVAGEAAVVERRVAGEAVGAREPAAAEPKVARGSVAEELAVSVAAAGGSVKTRPLPASRAGIRPATPQSANADEPFSSCPPSPSPRFRALCDPSLTLSYSSPHAAKCRTLLRNAGLLLRSWLRRSGGPPPQLLSR